MCCEKPVRGAWLRLRLAHGFDCPDYVAFMQNGEFDLRGLLLGGDDEWAALEHGQRRAAADQGGHMQVNAVALTPDGRRVVSGATDGCLRLWDLESGEELWLFRGHVDKIYAVARNQMRDASSEDSNSHYRFHIEVVDGDPRYGVALHQEKPSYLDRSEWQKQFHLRLAKTIATIIVKRGSENN